MLTKVISCIGILILWSSSIIYGQGFSQSFAFADGEIETAVALVLTENKYYFFGLGRTNGANPSNLGVELFVTDTAGNLLYARANKQLGYNFDASLENSFVKRGNELLYACTDFSAVASTDHYRATLTAYDSLLNIKWQRQYLGNNSFFRSLQLCPNGDILVLGEKGGGGNVDIFLLKLDSLGNEKWQRYYGGSADDVAYTLDILDDGNYLIGAKHVYNYWPNMDGWLIKTDTAGNVLWDRLIESPGADFGAHVFGQEYFFQAKDTVYKLPGGERSEAISYFAHFDAHGNILWQEEIEIKYNQIIRDALKLKDGGYLIVQDYIDYDYQGQIAWLRRYDAARNLLWERYYFYESAKSNGLIDVKEDAAGNFVFAGTILTSDTLYNADIWALKLNADGCLHAQSCGEPIGILDLTPAKARFGVQVSPNPALNETKVLVKNTSAHVGKHLHVAIYTSEGKEVYSQSQKLQGQLPLFLVSVAAWQKGVYYVKASIGTESFGTSSFFVR